MATALTVFIISYAYSRIIEYFPSGGGGYIVATHTLGEKAGVLSGSALLVDYMLTITVSIVSCGDAIFSFFPASYQPYKTPFEILAILFLVVINLRGIKESVTLLAPIFILFVVTHVLMIGYGVLKHIPEIGAVAGTVRSGFQSGLATLGFGGMALLFLRAFSMGGGTFTGIEAVSNGLQIMREPRVHNGKRTMVYLSTSLALTAGGILVCYLLLGVGPVAGKTLNAVLAGEIFGGWRLGGLLALVTIFAEGALLLVAAQTGFVDGPRVMANMAVDYWFPHRFASLSDRLTMQNGVLLMGGAAIGLLIYSKGRISTLVVMYSINVFLTFSLSELGMSRFFIRSRKKEPHWKKHLPVHLTGLTVCLTILVITTLEKFTHGGWLTLVITSIVILLCYMIKGHYNRVRKGVRELDDMLTAGIAHKGDLQCRADRPQGDDGHPARQRLLGLRRPHLPVRHPGLPRPLQELRLRLRGRSGRRRVQGDRVRRPPDRGDQGLAQEVRRPGPPAGLPGRVALRHRHRRRRDGLGPLRVRGQGVPQVDRLRRPDGLPPARHHQPHPPQRDGLRHPAGAPLERDHDGHFANSHQYLASLAESLLDGISSLLPGFGDRERPRSGLPGRPRSENLFVAGFPASSSGDGRPFPHGGLETISVAASPDFHTRGRRNQMGD